MAKSKPALGGLQAVARAAGVSPMTVSRVFRRNPSVLPENRRAVERAARKLGYQPDPQIARLMAQVRSHRQRRLASVIAVVRDDSPDDALHDTAYQYVSTEDIRRRAERHGYRVEEFFVGRDGMTAERLVQILRSRGIEGLILSPQSSKNFGARIDYSHFAAATFGYGLQEPMLHRAGTNMTRGILQTSALLVARGYRRIGLALTQWMEARADQTNSGAMLNFQRNLPPRERIPPLLFPSNNVAENGAIFCRWVKQHRPDVVISFDSYVPDWLTRRLGLRIPEDIGLVVHDWRAEDSKSAGIHHQRPHVAAAVVDLIVTQLMQNERGVPEVPRQILIPPLWVEGPSVRPHEGIRT
jgi:LacI family transcriptional regulator